MYTLVKNATEMGVMVTNVPTEGVEQVSDHAVGMALACTCGWVAPERQMRNGIRAMGQAQLRRIAQLTCGISGWKPAA